MSIVPNVVLITWRVLPLLYEQLLFDSCMVLFLQHFAFYNTVQCCIWYPYNTDYCLFRCPTVFGSILLLIQLFLCQIYPSFCNLLLPVFYCMDHFCSPRFYSNKIDLCKQNTTLDTHKSFLDQNSNFGSLNYK